MIQQSHNGFRIVAQVEYRHTSALLSTAKNIISNKCHNCACLLRRLLRYHRKYPNREYVIQKALSYNKTIAQEITTDSVDSSRKILLLEARAAHLYWEAVETLIYSNDDAWKRTYPHAKDPYNIAFNIGYTFLARKIREEIVFSKRSEEIGIFHIERNNHDPLVYDIMELYRQPVVDSVVVALFTKKKQAHNEISAVDIARLIKKLEQQWERPVMYRGKCFPIREMVSFELHHFATCIEQATPWHPELYPWGHNWNCNTYRTKRK